ncbi:hypothetical protein Sjap_009460 [Stephania japonica]|uniref:Uncharacterized protein n=1 Tax=Stephania japonica TaxID=461633 RepID=A0AAP0PFG6_9MAGN
MGNGDGKGFRSRKKFSKMDDEELCRGHEQMDRSKQQKPSKLFSPIVINEGYYKLSCLSMVILVKIVALSVPFTLAEPILRALDETFEIVYYIDEKVNVGNYPYGIKRRFAKVLLVHKNVHLSKKDSTANNLGMLLFFLPQLPIVALKDMNESPIEIREERARSALKLLCKLKLLQDKVQWSFPEGITRLIDPDDDEEECPV